MAIAIGITCDPRTVLQSVFIHDMGALIMYETVLEHLHSEPERSKVIEFRADTHAHVTSFDEIVDFRIPRQGKHQIDAHLNQYRVADAMTTKSAILKQLKDICANKRLAYQYALNMSELAEPVYQVVFRGYLNASRHLAWLDVQLAANADGV